jgi:hypothetical protein
MVYVHLESEVGEYMNYGVEVRDEAGARRVDFSGGETMSEVFGSDFALVRGCGSRWKGGLRELPRGVLDIRRVERWILDVVYLDSIEESEKITYHRDARRPISIVSNVPPMRSRNSPFAGLCSISHLLPTPGVRNSTKHTTHSSSAAFFLTTFFGNSEQ